MNNTKGTFHTILKIKLILVALLITSFSFGQVTIASDGLNNATSLFTLSGGNYYTGTSAGGDLPSSSPFFSEGTHSRGVSNGTATLTSNGNINTSLYTSISMTVRLASFSIGAINNGADGADVVTIEVSANGGTTWYSTVRVLGSTNATWSYSSGTANASTAYDGNNTPVDFAPTALGAQTSEGYSTITVTGLPSTTTLQFRITMKNNATSERWVVDDFKVQGVVACVPPTIASVFPTSGPVGTNVTINASSGNLSGATATFNGLAATVVSTAATQMIVVVPAGATSGNLTVTNTSACPVPTPFTIIKEDKTSCDGLGNITDLIISEVYDSDTYNEWHMELFNPTSFPIDLAASNYAIEKYGDINDSTPDLTIPLTGIVPAGGVILLDLGDSVDPAVTPCPITYGFTKSNSGINENDKIKLTKGGVVFDIVNCPSTKGYTIERKDTATGPKTTFSSSDWTTSLTESCAGLGIPPNIPAKNPPVITLQPVFVPSCTNETFTVAGKEGYTGLNALAYKWYELAPNSTTWNPLSNAGIYTGANTANLTISSVTGLDGYQYYCQVRENTATCYTASIAVMIKAGGSGGPVIATKTPAICSGTAFTVTPTNTLPDVVPTGTTYTWTAPVIAPAAAITGGSARTTPISSISQILTNTTSAVATATYTVTADSGGCSSTFTIIVTVNPIPTVTPFPFSQCGAGIVDLGASTSVGTISWFAAATGGTALATGTSFKPNITATTSYWVEASDGTCTSNPRVEVIATITSNATIPKPTVKTPVEYCLSATTPANPLTATITVPGATLDWYTTLTSTPALASAPTPSITTAGSTTYYVSQSVVGCEGPRAAIVVNVIADTSAKITYFECDKTQITTSNPVSSVFFDWNHVPGRSTNDYGYSYSIAGGPLVFGRTPLTGIEVFGVLPGQSVEITILNVPGVPCYVPQSLKCILTCPTNTIPDFPSIPATQSICTGSVAPILPPNSNNGISGTWLPATVSNIATGSYEFTPDVILFPCASKVKKEVVVVPLNDAGTISGNKNICGIGTTTLASTVSGGTWSSLNPTIATVNATGIVTGVSAGTATLEYTVAGTGVCPPNTKPYQVTVTALPNAGVLGGGPDVCQGQSVLFTSTVTGGTWSSLDTAIATVNAVSGSALGIAAGTTSIKYTVKGTNGCSDAELTSPIKVTALNDAGVISGNKNICGVGTTTLTSTVSGGTWNSLNPTIATVNAIGIVTGVSAGTATVEYKVTGSGVCPPNTKPYQVTVTALPNAGILGGGPDVCQGQSIFFTSTVTGGTWSSLDTAIATVNAVSGSALGIAAGTASIKYTVKGTNGCSDAELTSPIKVTALNDAGVISGNKNICGVGTTTLTSTVSGGTWTSINPTIATVNALGLVTGVAAGVANIEYTVTGSGVCPPNKKSYAVTVTTPPNAGILGGGPDVCQGQSVLFTSTVTGGTWSSLDTAIATVNAVSGSALGIAAGTTSIKYTVKGTNGCLDAEVTSPIKVTALLNAGILVGSQNICIGDTTPFSSSVGGGIWSSLNTAIATIDAAGIVKAISAGSTKMVYTVNSTGICPNAKEERIITVNPITIPNFNLIGSLCFGTNITLPTTSINTITGTWAPIFDPTKTTLYTFNPDAGQCAKPTTQTVTIIPLPAAIAAPDATSICSGGSTFIDLTAVIPGTTFSWNVVQTNATGAKAGSGSRIEPNLTTTGNKSGEAVYSITPNNSGCRGASIEVTIAVNPIPDVKDNTEKSTICSGMTTNILLTSKVVGTTYSWTVNASPNVLGALPGNANVIQQLLSTIDLNQGTVVYTITPDSNGCPGTSIDVTILVDPLPDGTAAVAKNPICSGETTKIDLSSTIGASFNWTVIQKGVTGATKGTGASIEQLLQAGTVAGTAEYSITPILNGCEGAPNPVTINVNPVPVAVIQEEGLLCIRKDGSVKSSFILNTNLSDADYDFVWYQDNVAIPPPLPPLLPPTSFYDATEIGDYYVAITNKLTTCSAESNRALITSITPAEYVDPPIVTDAFTDNATIIVNVFPPSDTYLYQIGNSSIGFGPLQSSNEFNEISGGPYDIMVTDAIGCTNLPTKARVISYPKFFTPNGDGYNDKWNIIYLGDQQNAKLYIYDRHGKLLKQLSTFGEGWDGTYNGKQLPASDYWFTINYFEDNVLKLFKAHFSLKR